MGTRRAAPPGVQTLRGKLELIWMERGRQEAQGLLVAEEAESVI